MKHDPEALVAALAAAVGEDAPLLNELKAAFLESAVAHSATMAKARDDANWRVAAFRLKGLAASFGALDLMAQADAAAAGTSGDTAAIERIQTAIGDFSR